jgi:hypothetical protein
MPTLDQRVDRIRSGQKWVSHRYQWLSGVPLRGDKKAMTVNWLMIEVSDANGKVTYRNSFITDLDVRRENVAELAAGGRARRKIENPRRLADPTRAVDRSWFNMLKAIKIEMDRTWPYTNRPRH